MARKSSRKPGNSDGSSDGAIRQLWIDSACGMKFSCRTGHIRMILSGSERSNGKRLPRFEGSERSRRSARVMEVGDECGSDSRINRSRSCWCGVSMAVKSAHRMSGSKADMTSYVGTEGCHFGSNSVVGVIEEGTKNVKLFMTGFKSACISQEWLRTCSQPKQPWIMLRVSRSRRTRASCLFPRVYNQMTIEKLCEYGPSFVKALQSSAKLGTEIQSFKFKFKASEFVWSCDPFRFETPTPPGTARKNKSVFFSSAVFFCSSQSKKQPFISVLPLFFVSFAIENERHHQCSYL